MPLTLVPLSDSGLFQVVPLVRGLGEAEDGLDHPCGGDRSRYVVHPQDPGAVQRAHCCCGDRRRRTVRLVQARRFADEVLVGDRGQQRQAEVGDLAQPPGQLQAVPGVLVQVVPGSMMILLSLMP